MLLLAVCLWATRAQAAVSCATPDNLCHGNPCVIHQIEVQSPCVVNFGDRTLVIGGTLRVPNGGVLSLSAGAIEVRRAIVGRHAGRYDGTGAQIELVSTGNIAVRWRIDASARTAPGSITLRAGRDIRLSARIRAASSGVEANAPGGTITMEAGGKITAIGRARMRVDGTTITPGGRISLSGARGVALENRIWADGAVGGSVDIFSVSGDVTSAQRIDVGGSDGAGGVLSIVSQTGHLVTLEKLDADGTTAGGSILLLGGGGITAYGVLRARSEMLSGPGGTVVLSSDHDIVTNDAVLVDGASGGQISMASRLGAVRPIEPLLASGRNANGGSVGISGGGAVLIDTSVTADGQGDGGAVALFGSDLHLTNRGDIFARGASGGVIALSGGRVTVDDGARVVADGTQPGGSISLEASAGDLTLNGDFQARGRSGGRIEAQATGTVHAGGDFAARGSGCIALDAGSVDVSGGRFDTPVVDMCQ